jgi:transcriptional regulator with PAS, ATPase and Fis domain
MQSVQEGSFREDLFYRLNVFPICVPPLRDRADDILPLVDYFVDKFNKKLSLAVTGVDDEVSGMLMRYRWPGNIRELENLIERMMLLARGSVITASEVPPEFKATLTKEAAPKSDADKTPLKNLMRTQMENAEKDMIIRCLEESGGNVTKTAKLLGLSRKGLQLKMIKYNLRK